MQTEKGQESISPSGVHRGDDQFPTPGSDGADVGRGDRGFEEEVSALTKDVML
jgi:hypothetical protein